VNPSRHKAVHPSTDAPFTVSAPEQEHPAWVQTGDEPQVFVSPVCEPSWQFSTQVSNRAEESSNLAPTQLEEKMSRNSPPLSQLRGSVLVVPPVLVLLTVLGLLATLVMSGRFPGARNNGAGKRHESAEAGSFPLQKKTALYPRAIRLEHNGQANGKLLISTVTHPGGDAAGDFRESSDGGATFRAAATFAPPEGANGRGLCCATLYELPRRIGDMPDGTLLWAASFGQNEPDRRMTIRVFKSTDRARHWSPLSTVATASGTGGLWEPELSVDADGKLVCHYSDETDPGHSQKLVAVRSRHGVSWSRPHDTVASSLRTDRPGMPVVRRLPNGEYVMSYEVCGVRRKFQCVVHYRTSADGWDWGDSADLGIRPETADGEYFKHAPTLAWAPEPGNPQGRLLLIGQAMYRADGSRAPDSGRVIWTNGKGGRGPWRKVPAPVAVRSTRLGPCPNYSSALLPSSDGSRVLETATDRTGGQCRPYVAVRTL
jgi:hypothetical protein